MITRRQFGALAGATILLPALSKPGVSASGPVKIGLATQTEGPALNDGRANTRAFKTAISYINNKGGILGGRQVEGVIVPQGLTGETAKAAALRLAQREEVKILVGPQWSDNAPAGVSVAERYNLIFAPDQGGMWLYEHGYPGVLGLSCNARARTLPQLRWVEKQGYKSVVMLLADIDYGHDVEKMVKERWEQSNSPVKLADIIWYPFGQTELRKELTKAMGSNPDFVWSEEWSAPVAISLMKTLKELQYKGATSVTSSLTKEIVDGIPQEISEGVYTHMDYAPDPNVPANKEFTDYWEKEWGPGELPYRVEEVIWSQTVLVLLAMDKAGTEGDGTREGVLKIARAMRDLKWMSPKGDIVRLSKEGLGLFPRTPMVQIQGGQMKVIEYLSMTPNDWLASLPESWDNLPSYEL